MWQTLLPFESNLGSQTPGETQLTPKQFRSKEVIMMRIRKYYKHVIMEDNVSKFMGCC